MYKIGICDDNEEFCWKIEEYLIDYCNKIKLPIDIQIFTSGKGLIDYFASEGIFDLLFLDIELNDTNGVTIGYELRNDISNERTQIVYVSSKESYAMQLFQTRPMDFLIKPITPQDITNVIDTYCRLFVQTKSYFEYKSKKKAYRIDERSILYFQSVGKVIHLFTSNGENCFYGKLSDVLKQINNEMFCCVHKSFIINTNYVSEYRATEIIMSNGVLIPISYSMRNHVKEHILKNQIAKKSS